MSTWRYQWFGTEIDEDASGVRMLAKAGIPLLVANSILKNLSVYGERCAALSILSADAEEADRVRGQFAAKIKANYSNPPKYRANGGNHLPEHTLEYLCKGSIKPITHGAYR